MRKTRFINFILLSALCISSLALTACNKNEDGGETTTTAAAEGETTTTGETTSGDETTTGASSEKTADELANIVLESVEFPMMQQYTTTEEMEQYAAISVPDDCEFSYSCQMMSVHLAEVFIIIAEGEALDNAYAVIEERAEKLMNDMAFYPTQQAAAEATVYGKKGNVAYIICVENAKDAEAALLAAI